jgi:FkbM family methyltransferase
MQRSQFNMGILSKLHGFLTNNQLTRKYQRRLTRLLKSKMGCPDAYGDMFRLAATYKPVAVLDIGSFIGNTIVRFTDELNIPVCGFEPTPDTFDKLSSRFNDNKQVRLFNLALSDKSGQQRFFCNENMQTNSLLDNDEGNKNSFSDATKHTGDVEIETETLDNWLDKNIPAGSVIIKSDVQGAEGMLVTGGENTFRNRVIAFYSETQLYPMYKNQASFSELDMKMRELGFVIHNIYPCMHDKNGRAIQTDVLWINSKYL